MVVLVIRFLKGIFALGFSLHVDFLPAFLSIAKDKNNFSRDLLGSSNFISPKRANALNVSPNGLNEDFKSAASTSTLLRITDESLLVSNSF